MYKFLLLYHLHRRNIPCIFLTLLTWEKIVTWKKKGRERKKVTCTNRSQTRWEHGVVCLFLLSSTGSWDVPTSTKKPARKRSLPPTSDSCLLFTFFFFFPPPLFLQFLRARIRRIRQTGFFLMALLKNWVDLFLQRKQFR